MLKYIIFPNRTEPAAEWITATTKYIFKVVITSRKPISILLDYIFAMMIDNPINDELEFTTTRARYTNFYLLF